MKQRFLSTTDLALASVFCALWVVLNITVAPIGFRLTGLPVVHDFITFFTFLLVVWATRKFGAVSFVGIIGATIVLFAGGPLPALGFAAASPLFDAIMLMNRHRLQPKTRSIAVATLATLASAYLAGVLIGIFITKSSLELALTFWGGWHLIGGIISLAISLPIIGLLEKANVRRINNA